MHSRPDAPSTFPLPRIKSIPDTHTHSRPDAPSTSPLPRIKLIPDKHTHSRPDVFRPSLLCVKVYSQRFIGLATAVGQSLIAYLPRSMRLSLSFLAPYIYVSSMFLCYITRYPPLVFYVSSSVPRLRLPLFHLSLFLTSVDPL